MPTPKTWKIALLPGDGVGPEVIAATKAVLQVIGDFYDHDFQFSEHLIGGAGIDAVENPLPQDTIDACLASDGVLLGAGDAAFMRTATVLSALAGRLPMNSRTPSACRARAASRVASSSGSLAVSSW